MPPDTRTSLTFVVTPRRLPGCGVVWLRWVAVTRAFDGQAWRDVGYEVLP